MKYFFWTSALEFPKIIWSRNDRESISLWLEHHEYYDDEGKYDKKYMDDVHNEGYNKEQKYHKSGV